MAFCLQALSFEGCAHLRDEHIALLAPLAPRLTTLSLGSCMRLLRSTGLQQLTSLTSLRQLCLREMFVSDAGRAEQLCHFCAHAFVGYFLTRGCFLILARDSKRAV